MSTGITLANDNDETGQLNTGLEINFFVREPAGD